MSNIMAQLAREKLLGERVVAMENDPIPSINPNMPQNLTPSSAMNYPKVGGVEPWKPEATGDKAHGSVDSNNVVNGDQPPKPQEAQEQVDKKRLLVESAYFQANALSGVLGAVNAEADYVQSQYGADKKDRLSEMISQVNEMKKVLTEMFNVKDPAKASEEPAPTPQQNATSQEQAPQDKDTQTMQASNQVPAVQVRSQP